MIVRRNSLFAGLLLFFLVPAGPAQTESRKDLAEQAWWGQGGVVVELDAKSGRIVSGVRLENMPTFDAMASAYGNLYIATEDGALQCLGEGGDPLPAIEAGEVAEFNSRLTVPEPPKKKQKGPKKQPAKRTG